MPQIEVFQDADELATQAAWEFSELAKKTIAVRGRFVAALSGGSTPKRMFQQLTKMTMDWRHIHLFWVDERCVSPDHPDSNFGMTAAILLNHIEIPMENVHRIQGELPPEQAALNYENELQGFFGQKFPVFDLILLGLGSDGHTASLFPGSPALAEETRWVTAVEHRKPPPPLVDRVTLTFPVLMVSKMLLFLVSGAEKKAVLFEIFSQNPSSENYPAAKIALQKTTSWFVDQEAAAKLNMVNILQ
jgi:6-phosphogluconolactonase